MIRRGGKFRRDRVIPLDPARCLTHLPDAIFVSDIARRSGRDRKTIRKYLKRPWQAPKREPTTPPSKLDPFKDYLVKRWDEGVTNAVKLLDEIKGQGCTGGYTIVKDCVSALMHRAMESENIRAGRTGFLPAPPFEGDRRFPPPIPFASGMECAESGYPSTVPG